MKSFDQSQQYALRALAIHRERLPVDDSALAATLQQLGDAARMQAKYAMAEANLLECAQIRQKKPGQEDALLARCLCDLGHVYCRMGRYADAETNLRTAIAVARRARAAPQEGMALTNLGIVYTEQHRFADAEPVLREGADLNRQIFGDRSHISAWSAVRLAQLYEASDRNEQAESTYRQAIEVFRSLPGQGRFDETVALSGLGAVLLAQGKFDE